MIASGSGASALMSNGVYASDLKVVMPSTWKSSIIIEDIFIWSSTVWQPSIQESF